MPPFSWATRFNQLVEFMTIHSHCNVPQGYTEHPQLGNWVQRTRTSYKAYHTDGQKGLSWREMLPTRSKIRDSGSSLNVKSSTKMCTITSLG
mmetsp:Transcript_11800/g.19600  ORF Transcript_11800/g.19600 Transcript_11800/m.19600 type:complete len:92 (-) Transcript_11800:295-570(-)